MKIIHILVVLAILSFINCDNCGGNCPANNCTKCTCGNTVNIINLSDYCDLMIQGTKSPKSCCMCIASMCTKGNANYIQQFYWESIGSSQDIGLLPISDLNQNFCGFSSKGNFCNSALNAKCAGKLFNYYNDWRHFPQEAQACGCNGHFMESNTKNNQDQKNIPIIKGRTM